MKNQILILMLSVVTLFACSRDSLNYDEVNLSNQKVDLQTSSSKMSVTRPFKIKKAVGTFSVSLGDGISCSALFLNALGEGTVTHLGRSTLLVEWCWDGNPDDIGTKTLALTAANGDVLHGTYNFIQWTSETTFEQGLVFDGGTGRFENATGEFNESIVITWDTEFSGAFTASGEGTLTY